MNTNTISMRKIFTKKSRKTIKISLSWLPISNFKPILLKNPKEYQLMKKIMKKTSSLSLKLQKKKMVLREKFTRILLIEKKWYNRTSNWKLKSSNLPNKWTKFCKNRKNLKSMASTQTKFKMMKLWRLEKLNWKSSRSKLWTWKIKFS